MKSKRHTHSHTHMCGRRIECDIGRQRPQRRSSFGFSVYGCACVRYQNIYTIKLAWREINLNELRLYSLYFFFFCISLWLWLNHVGVLLTAHCRFALRQIYWSFWLYVYLLQWSQCRFPVVAAVRVYRLSTNGNVNIECGWRPVYTLYCSVPPNEWETRREKLHGIKVKKYVCIFIWVVLHAL